MSDVSSDGVTPSDDLPQEVHIPSIVVWNRLEPRPRTDKFDRSLRAEVHDALWMLARQWQFGEFKGEDAGSAVFAKVKMETTRITRYAARHLKADAEKAVAYDQGIPLEAKVEREPIPMDLQLRLQMGQHWFRLLRHHGLGDTYRELYRRAYPIRSIEDLLAQSHNLFNQNGDSQALLREVAILSNQPAMQLQTAVAKRAMDGGAFYEDLRAGKKAEDVVVNESKISDQHKGAVAMAAADFLAYFDRLFTQPESSDDAAWAPEYLEYQLACSVPEPGDTQTVLRADEYYQGHLDWYSFDIDPAQAELKAKEGQAINDDVIIDETVTFLATEVHFPGMPNRRWWEFEDGRTNFGDIDAHTTDIAKLLLIEFGLTCTNDWLVIPYVVPLGSLCEIKGLVITDVFGQRILIKPAGSGPDDAWQQWRMFNLSTIGDDGLADNRLFLPPAVGKLLESSPVEKVTFLRDEMANMVWAVESQIPNDAGGGMDGYEAATDLVNFLESISTPAERQPPVQETEALIRYVLGTTVPENWIPLIPVHAPGSNREIQLRRAAMTRMVEGLQDTYVEPRGEILRPDLGEGDAYHIHEEEVPRAGAIATRTYQRARWYDGKTYLWLGRRKQAGRGEGSSGLKFDQIEPIESGAD